MYDHNGNKMMTVQGGWLMLCVGFALGLWLGLYG